jgi:hypothetical protein
MAELDVRFLAQKELFQAIAEILSGRCTNDTAIKVLAHALCASSALKLATEDYFKKNKSLTEAMKHKYIDKLEQGGAATAAQFFESVSNAINEHNQAPVILTPRH